MKIALAQINPTIGDLDYNFKIILENIEQARKWGAELIIFPELSLLGYPPKDLLLNPFLLEKQNHYIQELLLYTDKDFAVIVGGITPNKESGKRIFNSLLCLHDGTVACSTNKMLLPNYDVFDETRYFEAASQVNIFEYKNIKFGLSICEDIWIEAYPSLYRRDPIEELVAQGSDIIINAAASPFVTDKPLRRKNLLSNVAKRYKKPILYVNQAGANDQLIFDGRSLVIDSEGNVIKALKEFSQDCICINSAELKINNEHTNSEKLELASTKLNSSIDEINKVNIEQVKQALILGIKDYVHKCGFDKVVLGLSGGIDSALVAYLAVEALGSDKVYALMLASKHTSQMSLDDATQLAKNLGLTELQQEAKINSLPKIQEIKADNVPHYQILSIENLHSAMLETVPYLSSLADENLQARLRANILMTVANTLEAMLLNTSNKSELAVGYSTMYGDSCGGLAVIADLLKTTVYKLANYINEEAAKEIIPKNIISRAPSAELRPNQTDQDSLPPYAILDNIVLLYIQEMKSPKEIIALGYDPETTIKILNMIDRSEYKRHQAPPGLKIAGKAFGIGRRMPIAQGFKHIINSQN